MRINRHDTNGAKPLLGKGELGYDDYTAGGDIGRVYVGTSAENIALAKRLEANTMTKAQFNALAEERKANRAGSGFDSFGKGSSTTSVNVNEGIWTDNSQANKFYIGKTTANSGTSITNHTESMVNGILQKFKNINHATLAIAEILLPTAPSIYPYDTVLTAEQIASGVIKHADASNSGLIVNGKFDTDTSGWNTINNPTLSIDTQRLKLLVGSSYGVAYQTFSTVAGKTYIVEYAYTPGTNTTGYVKKGNSISLETSLQNLTTADGIFTTTFVASSTTTYLGFFVNGSGLYAEFDNIAVYPADAISRSDLVFLESWHEDISEKNIVYPLGNTQYLGGNIDGLTEIANGSFTGFETYSLFGNWQTPSSLIGKGYAWSSLTEAQKKSFISNPDNNCYLDGGKVIQVRYRVRVVQGLGDNWNSPLNRESWVGYGLSVNSLVKAKGKQVSSSDFLTSAVSEGGYVGGITTSKDALNLSGDYGIYGASNNGVLATQCGYDGKCFALPIALVHR